MPPSSSCKAHSAQLSPQNGQSCRTGRRDIGNTCDPSCVGASRCARLCHTVGHTADSDDTAYTSVITHIHARSHILVKQDHHHNGDQVAGRPHILCLICDHPFRPLATAVRLFTASVQSQPTCQKMGRLAATPRFKVWWTRKIEDRLIR